KEARINVSGSLTNHILHAGAIAPPTIAGVINRIDRNNTDLHAWTKSLFEKQSAPAGVNVLGNDVERSGNRDFLLNEPATKGERRTVCAIVTLDATWNHLDLVRGEAVLLEQFRADACAGVEVVDVAAMPLDRAARRKRPLIPVSSELSNGFANCVFMNPAFDH